MLDPVQILFALVKIVIVLGFLITVAGLLTWAERRQSAMIQDRIGPNRAVIYLPNPLVKALVGGGGVLAAVAVLVLGYAVRRPGPAQIDVRACVTELAILATWIGLVVVHKGLSGGRHIDGPLALLTRMRDRRAFFYVGLAAHALILFGWMALPRQFSSAVLQGAEPLPAASSSLEALMRGLLAVGPAWLALALFAGTAWNVTGIAPGPIGLRLAGILHLLADGAKMAFKEDFIPGGADRLLHSLGPLIALFPALVTFAVVPFGDTLCLHSAPPGSGFFAQLRSLEVPAFVPRDGVCAEGGVSLQIATLNVGILYMFALAGTGVVGAALAGYSSDNKFSLLGALRASSQMVSYEVAMGMTLIGAFMIYGTVRLEDMVRWQAEHAWGIFVQPFAFVLFLAAAVAEQKRVPFDAPEGESEIVAGYFVEYSGMKWGMFYLGEYMEVVTSSAVLATIFFGGWALPFLHRDGISISFGGDVLFALRLQHWGVVLIGAVAFFAKVLLICWAQLFIRWTVPRFRYDQIMNVGWRMLFPSALANVLVTGVVVLAIDRGGLALHNGLGVAGDVSQAIVALAGLFAVIKLISGALAPAPERVAIASSASRFARARGGTKMSPMQA